MSRMRPDSSVVGGAISPTRRRHFFNTQLLEPIRPSRTARNASKVVPIDPEMSNNPRTTFVRRLGTSNASGIVRFAKRHFADGTRHFPDTTSHFADTQFKGSFDHEGCLQRLRTQFQSIRKGRITPETPSFRHFICTTHPCRRKRRRQLFYSGANFITPVYM